MKDWPKKGTVDFEELVDPLRKAVSHIYDLKRKNADQDSSYDGYGFSVRSLRATTLNPEEALTAKNLQYSDEEQGRDPMTTILSLAVQLGICQGQRMCLSEQADKMEFINLLVKSLETKTNGELINSLKGLLKGLTND